MMRIDPGGVLTRLFLLFLLILAAPGAQAQSTTPGAQADPADVQTLRQCLARQSAHTADTCRRLVFQPCVDKPDGGTTLGTTACHLREYRAWDVLLNEAYARVAGHAEAMDRVASRPEFAQFESTLLSAQRAWITLRDADCALDYARFGDGSMRHIAHTACLSRMTADRTLFLLRLLEG